MVERAIIPGSRVVVKQLDTINQDTRSSNTRPLSNQYHYLGRFPPFHRWDGVVNDHNLAASPHNRPPAPRLFGCVAPFPALGDGRYNTPNSKVRY